MTSSKSYVYVFTRMDMSPEQVVVQSAHATYQLGINRERDTDGHRKNLHALHDHEVEPEDTHFTLVGVRDVVALHAIETILHKFGVAYEIFYELDVDGHTSIATYPVPQDKRDFLMAFDLLKFNV